MRLVIDISRDLWITPNGRYHWAVAARKTRGIRRLAASVAKSVECPSFDAAHITISVGYSTNRRADPDNSSRAVKAIIDGLVDAGVFRDDDSRIVRSVTTMRGETHRIKGLYRLIVDISGVQDED